MAHLLFKCIHATRRSFTLHYTRSIQSVFHSNKSVILVNGLFPGPAIRAKVGDELSINVYNLLSPSESLAVHWHGLHQFKTPWSDGTAGVTNCPLYYGRNHTYVFTVNVTGTYWYHPHKGAQNSEGGYGFLIVEEHIPLAVYDEELLVILSDIYEKSYNYLEDGLTQLGYDALKHWPGNGMAILVNGVAGPLSPTIQVQPKKTYRLRLLNAASLAYFNLAIAGHNMTVIQTGGTPTKHVVLDSIDINVAERFDVLISTDQPPSSYRINVQIEFQVSLPHTGTSQPFHTLYSSGRRQQPRRPVRLYLPAIQRKLHNI